MQKFQKLLLLTCIAWLSVSCSEDDESTDFVGIWEGSSLQKTDCMNPVDNTTTRRSCDDTQCFRLILNGDNSFSFQEGLPIKSGRWDVSGDSLSLCIEEDGEEVCETFIVSLTSVTLSLGTLNEANGCLTNQIFDRVQDTSQDEDPNS